MTKELWQALNSPTEEAGLLLSQLIEEAEAILVGIGSGMSAATGFVYSGPRFSDVFSDFIDKYGFLDMLQAFISDNWQSPEEEWAFMSRFAALNYFDQPEGLAYTQLKHLLEGHNYHIITTNADSAFYRSGYDMTKVFRCQGEYGLIQCSNQCHQQAYPLNPDWNQEMIDQQDQMSVPSHLIPRCPKCQAPMEINKRDAIRDMVEDPDFHRQKDRYQAFLAANQDKKLLLLELGVGKKTPQFIREPFQDLAIQHTKALYVTVNPLLYRLAEGVQDSTVRMREDIASLMAQAYQYHKEAN
ncbi:deacetylase SIR2 [Hutsoniella sourekii]